MSRPQRRAVPIYEYRCRECAEVAEALVLTGGKGYETCSK
jgi:predicted nucleic acid-binding Zn ribbon protein